MISVVSIVANCKAVGCFLVNNKINALNFELIENITQLNSAVLCQ